VSDISLDDIPEPRYAILNEKRKAHCAMSCYLRHLGDVIDEAGIELTKENRKSVDHAIRRVVGKADCNCPEVWKEVKSWLSAGRREELIEGLKGGCRP
jgi:hypothetical protein